MMTGPPGRIRGGTPALGRMTGWTREEALGRRPAILKSGKHPPEFYERLWASIRAGHPFVERFVNRRKDGSEFLVWESVSPVKASDGTTQYFMAILTDLSEREQMLEALRHTEQVKLCLLYTSDAADERSSVDLGGRRIIKKKKQKGCRRHQKMKTQKNSKSKTK